MKKPVKSSKKKPEGAKGIVAKDPPQLSPRAEKFEKKRKIKRAKLEQKIEKLSQKTAPRHNIFVRILFAIGRFFRDKIWRKISRREKDFLSRRPHRSFYLTKHADAKRSLKIRGYFAFVGDVWGVIWQNKWLFTKFLLLYAVLSAIIVGIMNQSTFTSLRTAVDQAQITGLNKWWTLFSGAISGGISGSGTVNSSQQVIASLLFLYGWLTLVWLLRRIMNGDKQKLKLRDGLYTGGSPVLSTLALLAIIVLQIIPFALVLLIYSSVTAVGWINTGIQIENMAAWCALAIAAVATLYWMCSSFIALIIATLPGMYPFRALSAASDLVVGRRVKLVLRLIFMAIPIALLWIIVLLPAILIDNWLELTWQPLVPAVVLFLITLTIIWCATYVYLLYRRMVDDPAPPISPRKQKRMEEKAKKKSAKKANKKPGKLAKLLNKIRRK
ncbi:hypothetical protein FWF74_02670 [Candidatus Saccharibacteria bacterium]|nr:hypothetical protein [Candidatus Saccharibacteria bacterium]MCL1962730.1 hypothetical protein [Candidatus Saccharibacteria bacterium]